MDNTEAIIELSKLQREAIAKAIAKRAAEQGGYNDCPDR